MTSPERLCGACDSRPTRDTAVICDGCSWTLEKNLGDMPALLADLQITEARLGRIDRGTSRDARPAGETWDAEQFDIPAWLRTKQGRITLPSTPTPFDGAAMDLRWEAEHDLAVWAAVIAEAVGATKVPAPISGFLLLHLPAIRVHPKAAAIAEQIAYLHAAIERRIDRPPVRLFAGPCEADTDDGKCGLDLYTKSREAPTVKCDGFKDAYGRPGCGTLHDTADRRDWLCEDVIEDALVTVDDLLAALPVLMPELYVNKNAVRRHAARGRFEAKSVDRQGREMYRGGDILAYIRDEAIRPGPKRHPKTSDQQGRITA